METEAQKKLKAFRKREGLSVRAAGALIRVDGKPTAGVTWHGWEAKGKPPKPAWMAELTRLGITEPNDFYPRPDAGEIDGALQPALL